jgi:hypothetical protein
VAETVRRLLCCGFRRTGTSVSILMENFFRLEYHMFYDLYPFVTHLAILSRTTASYLNLLSAYCNWMFRSQFGASLTSLIFKYATRVGKRLQFGST